jgi:glycosyl transferase family 87
VRPVNESVGDSLTLRGQKLPPLWLAAATVAAAWVAGFGITGWVVLFIQRPIHSDFRVFYVAGEAAMRDGLSSIYDLSTLRALSNVFPAGQNTIQASTVYVNPPLLAWLVAPLTAFPYPAAYAVWTAILLSALVWSWWITCSSTGLAKVTLLLAALALWPVIDDLYYGQSCLLILGLVAASWWLCDRQRPVAGGIALALATMLKPQDIFVVPFALLASGRVRPFVGWSAGCAVLAILFWLSLGQSGVEDWGAALAYEQQGGLPSQFTATGALPGLLAVGLEAVQAALGLVIAWKKRAQLELVFAAGLVGSIAASFFLHQSDYSVLVLAGWLILRTAPSRLHLAWLGVGLATMQAVSLSMPLPQIVWNGAWLVAMTVSSFAGSGASAPATRRASASAVRADR